MADACFNQQLSTDRTLMYVTVGRKLTNDLAYVQSQTGHDMGYIYPGPDTLT